MSQSFDLLTVPEVMASMQISRHSVYRLIRSRQLTSVTIGRSRRIPVAALAAFVVSASMSGGV
ncbi:helix-turn-helix domain-containing protein [Actinocrinis puniceicyclus]|uniref:Helix-turn-helix domain-containing protein n=1 Tax=Actinocrinis puniceicyclus TaxID=977794 RepID=A0A8J7WWR9_9ACTN|nr:helix-turn-helix domain-containing protein [Actinocrinis puniceicyclus]MBS2966514.1 helix-turn-helix domain-containing protein [Actinocrinis puniceicyclus]